MIQIAVAKSGDIRKAFQKNSSEAVFVFVYSGSVILFRQLFADKKTNE